MSTQIVAGPPDSRLCDETLLLIRRWQEQQAAAASALGTSQDPRITTLAHQVAFHLLSIAPGVLPWRHSNNQFAAGLTPEKPQSKLLFAVNWASTGPGMDWPEAYFQIYVEALDISVVTASRDSDDVLGALDTAIGWYAGSCMHTPGPKDIICSWWSTAFGEEQPPWEDWLKSGEVTSQEGMTWAATVWDDEGQLRRVAQEAKAKAQAHQLEQSIEVHVRRAISRLGLPRSGGRYPGAWAPPALHRAAMQFAVAHHQRHGELPQGRHMVGNELLDFGSA